MFDYIRRMLPPSFGKTDPQSDQGKEISALARVFSDIEAAIEDLKLQFFAAKATWGLKYWEKELGLPTDPQEALEQRRARVMAKLIPPLITPERFRSVLRIYAEEATLEEIYSEYLLRVWLRQPNVVRIDGVLDTIEKQGLVPAHLAYELGLEYTDNQLDVITRVVKGITNEFFRCNRLICGQHWNEGHIESVGGGVRSSAPIFMQTFALSGLLRSGPVKSRTNEGRMESTTGSIGGSSAVLFKAFHRCGTIQCGEVAL